MGEVKKLAEADFGDFAYLGLGIVSQEGMERHTQGFFQRSLSTPMRKFIPSIVFVILRPKAEESRS